MRSRTDRIRFDFKLRDASPGCFDILLHLYADERFASETSIVTVDGPTAIRIVSVAVKYLSEKGYKAHVSELETVPPLELMAA